MHCDTKHIPHDIALQARNSETRLDSFVLMAKHDMNNEKMHHAAVERAHASKGNRNPGEHF